jgi:hypothetical protein
LLELSILLNEQSIDRASHIPLLLSSRVAFSDYLTTYEDMEAETVEISLNDQFLGQSQKDDLFCLLWHISNLPRERHPTEIDLDTILAELEDRTRLESLKRDRIDEGLYNCLSDLAAIHDFQSRLELRRPPPNREIARSFLKSPRLKNCDYKIILTSQARKTRHSEFKDFHLPDFDDRCQALMNFVHIDSVEEALEDQELKTAKLQVLKDLMNKQSDFAVDAMHLFWKEMREHRCVVFNYAACRIGNKWTQDDVDVDLLPISATAAQDYVKLSAKGLGRILANGKDSIEIFGPPPPKE